MTEEQIKSLVDGKDIVLFMKGTKDFPQCGFSAAVVQILDALAVDYQDINVLENDDLREGIKSYSNWPTIPQVYVKSEFIGGCDIVREMAESGELVTMLRSKDLLPNSP